MWEYYLLFLQFGFGWLSWLVVLAGCLGWLSWLSVCLGWEKHLNEFEKYMGIYLVWLSGGLDILDRWCGSGCVALTQVGSLLVCRRGDQVHEMDYNWFWLGCLGWDTHLDECEKYMGILFTIFRIWFGLRNILVRGLECGLLGWDKHLKSIWNTILRIWFAWLEYYF